MQQTTNTTKTPAEVKNYKLWVMKAHTAAIKAEKDGIKKEHSPSYIAADNIAKQFFAHINKFVTLLIIILCLSTGIKAQL